jgi:hypothetical protein
MQTNRNSIYLIALLCDNLVKHVSLLMPSFQLCIYRVFGLCFSVAHCCRCICWSRRVPSDCLLRNLLSTQVRRIILANLCSKKYKINFILTRHTCSKRVVHSPVVLKKFTRNAFSISYSYQLLSRFFT